METGLEGVQCSNGERNAKREEARGAKKIQKPTAARSQKAGPAGTESKAKSRRDAGATKGKGSRQRAASSADFQLREELAHAAEFLVALVHELAWGKLGELIERAGEERIEHSCGGFGIVVGAALGLWNDFVN